CEPNTLILPLPKLPTSMRPLKPREVKGGPRHSPRRIERPAAGEASQQMAVGVEDIDKAVTRTGYIVMLFCILLGIADEEIAIDVLDAERREAGRNVRIRESVVDDVGRHQAFITRGAIGG